MSSKHSPKKDERSKGAFFREIPTRISESKRHLRSVGETETDHKSVKSLDGIFRPNLNSDYRDSPPGPESFDGEEYEIVF